MSRLSGFVAQINGERLHYNYTFVFVIEEFYCPDLPVSPLSGIDCIMVLRFRDV